MSDSVERPAPDAVTQPPAPASLPRSVLFIGHDALRTGAPIVLLHLQRWLKEHTGIRFGTLLVGGGPLEAEYGALGPTWVLERAIHDRPDAGDWMMRVPYVRRHRHRRAIRRRREALLADLRSLKADLVYANTVATWAGVEFSSPLGLPTMLHVHELEMSIEQFAGYQTFERLKARTNRYIAVSRAVRRNLIERHGIDPGSIDLAPGFIETRRMPEGARAERRGRLCEELGIDAAAPTLFVGACGTADWRKGIDLLIQVAARLDHKRDGGAQVHFVWLGGAADSLEWKRAAYDIEKAGLSGRFHLLSSRPGAINSIDLFDVFVLTSREDPYPLVMLEAADLAKPIVCFADSGGAPEFVEDDAGFVVPYLDVEAMAARVGELLDNEELRSRLGAAGQAKVRRQHGIAAGAGRILELIRGISPQAHQGV